MTMTGRQPLTHNLKCWPKPFQAMVDDLKPWEFRKDDRGYEVGDTLHLMEWVPEGDPVCCVEFAEEYTGRTLDVVVMHIVRGPEFGIPAGFCVMSVLRADLVELGLTSNGPVMADAEFDIAGWCQQMIEGGGGMNVYEERELATWPKGERIGAAEWIVRCLGNPRCEGSAEVLKAIIVNRQRVANKGPAWADTLPEALAQDLIFAGEFIAQIENATSSATIRPNVYTLREVEVAFRGWLRRGAPGTTKIIVTPDSAWSALEHQLTAQALATPADGTSRTREKGVGLWRVSLPEAEYMIAAYSLEQAEAVQVANALGVDQVSLTECEDLEEEETLGLEHGCRVLTYRQMIQETAAKYGAEAFPRVLVAAEV